MSVFWPDKVEQEAVAMLKDLRGLIVDTRAAIAKLTATAEEVRAAAAEAKDAQRRLMGKS